MALDGSHRLDRGHDLGLAPLLADPSLGCRRAPGTPSSLTWCAASGPSSRRPAFGGSSFPLALAAVATRGQDSGRLVGGVYAANTVGAIAGALVFSLLVIPWIGTAGAERALIGIALLASTVGGLCFLLIGRRFRKGLAGGVGQRSLLGWAWPSGLPGASGRCPGRSWRSAGRRPSSSPGPAPGLSRTFPVGQVIRI